MSATKLKAKIEEQSKAIEELNLKIQSLENSLEQEKVRNQNTIQTKELEFQEKDKIKTEEQESKIKELNTNLDSLKNELKESRGQLDRKELKKLAQAFNDQEEIHKREQKKMVSGSYYSCDCIGCLCFRFNNFN